MPSSLDPHSFEFVPAAARRRRRARLFFDHGVGVFGGGGDELWGAAGGARRSFWGGITTGVWAHDSVLRQDLSEISVRRALRLVLSHTGKSNAFRARRIYRVSVSTTNRRICQRPTPPRTPPLRLKSPPEHLWNVCVADLRVPLPYDERGRGRGRGRDGRRHRTVGSLMRLVESRRHVVCLFIRMVCAVINIVSFGWYVFVLLLREVCDS